MARFLDSAIASIGGDPDAERCEGCGAPWRPDTGAAMSLLRSAADRYADLLDAGDPYRHRAPLTWSPAAYTWHLADVCRAWAERVVALRAEPERPLAGFDPDDLAEARGYDRMAASGALWALDTSSRQLVSELGDSGIEVALHHPEWGDGTLADALAWVTHEAAHHEQDVRWILS